jgi:hypothetical protein
VPHIGWVFVLRSPVRGPTSRRALRGAKKDGAGPSGRGAKKVASRPSPAASAPMPVPKAPPPSKRKAAEEPAAPAAVDQKGKKSEALNPLLPFVEFVAHHPVGSPVDATVESFSSHGAYAMSESVRCYIPLRYLGKPAPRSAREVLTLGSTMSFTVVSIAAGRRGVDLAMPGFEPDGLVPTEAAPGAPAKAAATKKAAAKKATVKKAVAKKAAAPKKTAEKAAEKAAAKPERLEKPDKLEKAEKPDDVPVKKAAAKKAAVKKAATKKAPAEKAAAKKVAAKKSVAKKAGPSA